jgi:hypothetical protein
MNDLEQAVQDGGDRPAGAQWRYHVLAVEALQAQAWAAYNEAYHRPDAEPYRQTGRELYRRVLHERILAMFTKGDEQNSLIDGHREN